MAERTTRTVEIPAPDTPSRLGGFTHAALGLPRPTLAVAYTHVSAYEGVLWRCDVCMCVVAEFPADHPFIDADGLDAFERHAKWHRAMLELESRR